MRSVDAAVIGAGQAGLAVGYYLRRTGLSHVLLDAEPGPGGAWRHTWGSLRLFSPARWSSLPGWLMAGGPDYYPSRDELLRYVAAYEERYHLPVVRRNSRSRLRPRRVRGGHSMAAPNSPVLPCAGTACRRRARARRYRRGKQGRNPGMVWKNAGITHRSTVMGTRGMVASAHPLASLAGLRILMAGGNAVDAAVAASAALNVVEPYMSGLGGGGAMLVHTRSGGTLSLNYGGPVPAAARSEALDPSSVDVGPKAGVVPGIPAGWFAALDRFGTMPAGDLFAAAIEYAEGGVALTVKNSEFFGGADPRVSGAARAVFFPGSSTPPAGTVIRQPQLAASYRALAEGGADAFYRGPLGLRFVAAVQQAGGLMTAEDLARVSVAWSAPSVSRYRGFELRTTGWPLTAYETQLSLNILEGFDLGAMGHNCAGTIHTMAEAFKLAVADRIVFAGRVEPPPAGLLSRAYAGHRRGLIDPSRARPIEGDRYTRPRPPDAVLPGDPADVTRECTTHLDVVDADGTAVSITQSIGSVFGSGFMAGDTGIMLNNFLFFYDLDPASPNAIRPGVPWGGPLAPTMLFHDGRLFLSIGTPGGFGITQTTAQMISNVVDHGYGVQAAIEAPRFKVVKDRQLVIEDRVSPDVRGELARRGHDVQVVAPWSAAVGGGQGILIDPETGALSGGADPRRDGYALGW